jgi:hypothetical protein
MNTLHPDVIVAVYSSHYDPALGSYAHVTTADRRAFTVYAKQNPLNWPCVGTRITKYRVTLRNV